MAQSQGPRIDKLTEDLSKLSDYVDTIQTQVGNLNFELKAAQPLLASLEEMRETVRELRHQLAALENVKQHPKEFENIRMEVAYIKNTEIGFVKKDVDDLKKWQDDTKRQNEEFGRKLWLLVPPIVAAIVSSALTGLISYFIIVSRSH